MDKNRKIKMVIKSVPTIERAGVHAGQLGLLLRMAGKKVI